MSIHIIPINDLDTHDETTVCLCSPRVEFLDNGDMMIIHNSFDGREFDSNQIVIDDSN